MKFNSYKDEYNYMKQFYDSPLLDEAYEKKLPLFNNYVLFIASASKYCQPPWVCESAYKDWMKKRGYTKDPRYI